MFNENLKIIRKAKGYTQEELAIKIREYPKVCVNLQTDVR